MSSERRTTVAVLRLATGLSAEEFAQLIGKSLPTVRSLEAGKLALSESTSLVISEKTGVSFEWLMNGEPAARITDGEGKEWTHKSYETLRARGYPNKGPYNFKSRADEAADRVRRVIRDQAYSRDNFEIVSHRVSRFLWKLEQEFPRRRISNNGGMER